MKKEQTTMEELQAILADQADQIARFEKEAQIEAALERVRSKTMAMHQSSELAEVVVQLLAQLRELGLPLSMCFINIAKKKANQIETWITFEGDLHPQVVNLPLDQYILLENKSLDLKRSSDFISFRLSNNLLLSYNQGLADLSGDEVFISRAFPSYRDTLLSTTTYGSIGICTDDLLMPDDAREILPRFAKIFDQTYTRFLDLQKAEAQAREAQIEASLERIRAASMAMHKSEELSAVANAFFSQIENLGIPLIAANINIVNAEQASYQLYFANENEVGTTAELAVDDFWFAKKSFHQLKSGQKEFTVEFEADKIQAWIDFVKKDISQERGLLLEHAKFKKAYTHSIQFHDLSHTIITSIQPLSESSLAIVRRMSRAFGRSYTRFLDLQKAEVQAREAQIEAALERIRAASMAMHSSEGLSEVAAVLREQMESLGQEDLESTLVQLYEKGSDYYAAHYSFKMPNDAQKKLVHDIAPKVPWRETEWSRQVIQNYLDGQDHFIIHANRPMLQEWYALLEKVSPRTITYDNDGNLILPDELYYYFSTFSGGFLSVISYVHPSDETKELLNRTTRVFDMAYRRYLDLQKAESQAREAQIEAALERVRARSMAMQSTNESMQLVNTLFDQIISVGIPLESSWITLINVESKELEFWIRQGNQEAESITINGPDYGSRFDDTIKAYEDQAEEFSIQIPKEEYIPAIKEMFGLEFPSRSDKSTFHLFLIQHKYGNVGLGTWDGISDEEKNLCQRFAKVFEQSYTRFLDLQKAEAQAKEAQIEAALERVRSRTMYMQQSSELRDVVSVMYDEMEVLGLAKWGCNIMICHKDREEFEFWLAEESGSDQNRNYYVNGKEHPIYQDIWIKWEHQSDPFILHHQGEYKREFDEYWIEQTDFKHLPQEVKASVYGRNEVYLAYATMKHGLLNAISYQNPPENSLMILSRFAVVFEQAYTRFLDLKKTEAQALAIKQERDRLNTTLSELQATQAQLIQSEKMASLGELTAGIAHEIQNPLNFVNNFSDVSAELIDEAIEELETDPDEAKEILADLKLNLEKINHHGQRAESIVKGMLQHSRSGAGEKVPTDINALCDEYMRLAYHGLRAKDSSFNADYDLQLDDKIGKIDVVPQDMSRVILNIVTNAFQACHELSLEKKDAAYAPKVVCSTSLSPLPWRQAGLRESEGGITITISDNGGGIPKDVIDKVFQPFFTTKPTGQGTGLGLSMAYDIVKAHGGELRVDSVEGEGSTFIIQLPIN